MYKDGQLWLSLHGNTGNNILLLVVWFTDTPNFFRKDQWYDTGLYEFVCPNNSGNNSCVFLKGLGYFFPTHPKYSKILSTRIVNS